MHGWKKFFSWTSFPRSVALGIFFVSAAPPVVSCWLLGLALACRPPVRPEIAIGIAYVVFCLSTSLNRVYTDFKPLDYAATVTLATTLVSLVHAHET